MLEASLRRLEPSEIITSKLDQIIEAFVTFYGEERRGEIETRLKNTQILKFSSPKTLIDSIRRVKESLLREIYDNVPEHTVNGFDIESLIDLFTGKKNSTFDFISKDLKKAIFGNDTLSAEEAYEKFSKGEYPKLNTFLAQYEKLKPILAPYEKLIEEEEAKASITRSKYYKLLVDEFHYLIPDEELEKYEKYGIIGNTMFDYFDILIYDDGHCFDDEHEAILNNDDIPNYKKENVCNNRLRFLKKFGYRYQTYEECLKDEKCTAFIKELREICQKIATKKSELYRLQTIEITENLADYKKCREAINQKNYINKGDSLGPFVYESYGVSCCEINYTLDGEKMVMSPLVLINDGMEDFDCTVIHELNHAFEFYATELDRTHCGYYSGWDYEVFDFEEQQAYEQMRYEGISRDYELLSEYVNDRIAQEITDIMHEQDHFIIDSKRSKQTSSYMAVRFLVEPFYTEYKDIIIASRTNGNISYLYDTIGRENFEALNNLVNEYNEKFGFSFSGKVAVVNYYKNIPDEHTEEIRHFIAKRDQIMESMSINYHENMVSKATR